MSVYETASHDPRNELERAGAAREGAAGRTLRARAHRGRPSVTG